MKVYAGRLAVVDLLPITFFSISFFPFLNLCGFPFSKSVMVCVVRFPIAKPASDRCLFFSINLECCKKKQQREGDSEKEEKQVLGFYFEYGGVYLLSFFCLSAVSVFFFFYFLCGASLSDHGCEEQSPFWTSVVFFFCLSLFIIIIIVGTLSLIKEEN